MEILKKKLMKKVLSYKIKKKNYPITIKSKIILKAKMRNLLITPLLFIILTNKTFLKFLMKKFLIYYHIPEALF